MNLDDSRLSRPELHGINDSLGSIGILTRSSLVTVIYQDSIPQTRLDF